MTPTPPENPNPPGTPPPGTRPPKKGEPWPKRFSFTPDGSMNFVKHDADDRRRSGPRKPYPNRGPGPGDRRDSFQRRGPGGGPYPGPNSGRGPGSGPGRRPFPQRGPDSGERPRTWGPASAPGRPQFPGGPRGSYSRPQGPGSRPGGPWNNNRPRPSYPEGSRPDAGGPPRDRRAWNGPSTGRPAIQTGYRRPGNAEGYRRDDSRGPAPYRDDRRPAGPNRGFGGQPPRPGANRPERPRPERRPLVEDRTHSRPRPWSVGEDREGPVRKLPRPQSGDGPSSRRPVDSQDEVPAGREQLAARILSRATPTIPADLLLRQTLSRRKQLSRTDGAWISRAVFSTFRWQGWLDSSATPESRIEKALSLADDFAVSPTAIPDDDLIARAIPSWTGETLPVTAPWVRSLQAEPVLWLRTRPGMRDQVSTQLGFCEAPALPAFRDTLRYDGLDDLFRNELFQAGAFEIQDIASQAVGIICAPQPGENWWDACAGEGGKTLHLSGLMEGKGLVWASDRAEWRLNRLKQRAGRAGCFNYRSVLWDGGERPPTKTRFDGILVDAPCSGLGTWGRNPHARWTTSRADVTELGLVQRDLLFHAAPSVKPGGRLVYAVCTLTREETSEVVEAFTTAHPEFEPIPLENPFQPGGSPEPTLTLWPQDTGGNGMFIAAWRRKAE